LIFFVEVKNPAKRLLFILREQAGNMEQESVQTSTQLSREEQPVLKFLDPSQIPMIDEALSVVGEFGEVRLIVEKGRLRFVVTQKSFDAQKWQPGGLSPKRRTSRLSL